MKKLLISAALLFLALPIEALAQGEQPTLKPGPPPITVEIRGSYVLEVSYNPRLPPAYINVHGTETKPRWIWVTRFNHVAGWQYPEGVLPIRAVRFEAQYNGETADVRVTLLRGRQRFEQEDLVGTYHLGLDEPRTVTKLQDFGIEPARITLLNPAPVRPLWPGIINKTNSISVEKVSMENNPLPGYRVTFRNMSEKRLAALSVEVVKDSRGPISAFFQGEDGRALIEPGATSEQYLHAITDVVSGNRVVPVLPTPNSIMITSAVFSDGTYEGAVGPACMFEGFQLGRKVWLKTVLTLIDQQLTELDADGPQAAAAFKAKFNSLQYPVGTDVRQDSAVSNNCAISKGAIEATVNGQKLRLLRELDEIISTRPAPPINFKSWLQATGDRYRAWLSRL